MQIVLLTPWSIIRPMIFLYLWIVKHEYTIYNSLFQTNEQYKYTCELCTRPNQIQRERIASGNRLS